MGEWIPERLPEDLEAERALLATCCAPDMAAEAAEVAFVLREEDFVHPGHRALFRAMLGLVKDRLDINPLTLKDALDRAGDLPRVGGFNGIVEILSFDEVRRPSVLADILMRKRRLRDLIRLGAQLVRKAAAEEEPPETLVETAGRDLFQVAQGHEKGGLEHIAQVAHDAHSRLLERLESGDSTGVRLGFQRLDALTHGLQPGNLVVLAARPGLGKTALALNWLMHSSKTYGNHVAFFSLEMSKEEVFGRLLASHSSLNVRAVMGGDAGDAGGQGHPDAPHGYGHFDAVRERLLRARDDLVRLPAYICDRASITVHEITSMVDRLCTQADRRLDLVIIDYLQLISSPPDSRGSKLTEAVRVAEISRALKLMAKDRGMPVVVLSQLNREVEHRQSGRPQLSDLRDSGAIEQDADIVMFIHRRKRTAMDEDDGDPEKRAELVVAKHRNGPTEIIPMWFEGALSLFKELDSAVAPRYAGQGEYSG
jgi:replicative DNA helicase